MRINTNITALNSFNQLKQTNNNMSKSLERLSSGKRINKAADDAAGLAISEKMKGQINGLAQAQRNAQDGISMIQTAEGALKESHAILQRMRELAIQATNDTNTASDRAQIQKEVDQLSQELSRIGKTTEFNTQTLLNGTFQGTFQIGANESQNLSLTIGDMRGHSLGVAGKAKIEVTSSVTDGGDTNTDIADGTYSVEGNTTDGLNLINSEGLTIATSADGLSWNSSSGDDTITFTEAPVLSGTVEIDSGNVTATGSADNSGLEAGIYTFNQADGELVDSNGDVIATTVDDTTFTDAEGNNVVTFDAAIADGTEVSIGGTDISSQSSANNAITTLQSALDTVSDERSKLGAYQNRLEHTIANLSTAEENLTAAESRVSDVDMAKEMMDFTKSQILSQAGTAMLAQANQMPQGVLKLLG